MTFVGIHGFLLPRDLLNELPLPRRLNEREREREDEKTLVNKAEDVNHENDHSIAGKKYLVCYANQVNYSTANIWLPYHMIEENTYIH